MSDYQHTHVVPLCLLVSGTKHSHTILLHLTFFDFFNIIFDWYYSHDKFSKLLKETDMSILGHEISHNVIYGEPIYIQFIITDTVSYEK